MVRDFYALATCACGLEDLRSWPYEPSPSNRVCRSCGAALAIETRRENYVAHVPFTCNKRFQPHFSRAFGERVEDSYHLKHLQMIHGTEDAVLEHVRDGEAPSCVSRGFEREHKELVATAEATMASTEDVTDDLNTDFVTDLRVPDTTPEGPS